MKNNTTNHTTLNIRYTGKNWHRNEFMKLCSCQGTLIPQPRLHHNQANQSQKNKTVDGVRRIHKNIGLRKILGSILQQLHETTPFFNLIMDSRV